MRLVDVRLPLPNLPVPGPFDVLELVGTLREGLGDALDLVPRAGQLISRGAAVVERIESLLDSVDLLLVRVESVVDQVSETSLDAAAVLVRATSAAEGADELVGTASAVLRKGDRLVEGGTGLLDRSDRLLTGYSPVLEQLAPAMRRLAESLTPGEVDAAVSLIDRLPVVLTHLDEDVLPMLRQLDRVGPDVHSILEIVDDLRDVIAGLPGVGLLKKVGDRRELESG